MDANLWTTLGVALLGLAGTLAAAVLTQRQANRVERARWQDERSRQEALHHSQQQDEHRQWLREQRHQVYGELVRESYHFAAELVPLKDMAERVWDPESELYAARHRYFDLLYKASFIADHELQGITRRAADVAEDSGHQPYLDDLGEKSRFESELVDRAFSAARALEDASREELRLPPRRVFRPATSINPKPTASQP